MGVALGIVTNSAALSALGSLSSTSRDVAQSVGRLSSGFRVRSAADDPAGMAVSVTLRSQQAGFQQAHKNANTGISILQTAESAYQSISDTLVRMRELAVEASNDSLSDTERGYLDTEFQDLVDEIDRIADVTEFNDIKLMDGSETSLTFQVGTRNSVNDRIVAALEDQHAASLSVDSSAVGTKANAQSAITEIDTALESLNTDRASLGATINSLNVAVDNVESTIENYANAIGIIRDTDVGAESTHFATLQVRQQAGVAMLAQANAFPELALQLLS